MAGSYVKICKNGLIPAKLLNNAIKCLQVQGVLHISWFCKLMVLCAYTNSISVYLDAAKGLMGIWSYDLERDLLSNSFVVLGSGGRLMVCFFMVNYDFVFCWL